MHTSNNNKRWAHRISWGGAAAILLAATPASAEFQLVNDFQAGMGETTFVNTIGAGNGSADVVADPAPTQDVGNMVLTYHAGTALNNSARLTMPIPTIVDGTTATVFFRIVLDTSAGEPDGGIVLSPLENPTGFGDGRAMMVANASDQFRYRDGANYETVLENRTDLTWYKGWIVINNTDNTSSLYLQGGELATQTLVNEDAAFRNNVSGEDIQTLMLLGFAGGTGIPAALNAQFYFDDIYVDTEGENLTDPSAISGKPSLALLKTTANISIDGVRDSAGYTARGTNITRVPAGQVFEGPGDLSAVMHGAWSNDGIFLFVDLTDDVLASDNPEAYRDDSIEFFFDPNNSANGTFDKVDDIKVIVHPKLDGTTEVTFGHPTAPVGADTSGVEAATVSTDTGWAVEVFVPWAALQFEPLGNWTLGFDIQINDDDGNDLSDPAPGMTDRESYMTWSGSTGLNNNTDEFGSLILQAPKEIQVPRISSAITIDGTREGTYDESWINETDNRWVGATAHPADTSARMWVVADASNLYFYFRVVDDSWVQDSTDNWQDDTLELYLDGNNSKGGAFDGYDDVKLVFRPLDGGTLEVQSTGVFPAPPAGTDFSGLEAAHAITDTGWDIEVKVPFSIIKVDPQAGHAFGLDFAVLDDDDGDNREGTLTWNAGIGQNNQTDDFGTAYLFAPLSASVAPASGEISIDGNIDEGYGDSVWNVMTRTTRNSLLSDSDNLSGYWIGSYDENNLYIILDLIDDVMAVDSTDSFQDDSIELFFDPSNNSESRDSVEDLKITFVPQLDGTVTLITTTNFPAPPAGTNFEGVEAEWVATHLGRRVEIQVPFATLRINGIAGWDLGFDIQVNDDDDGGNTREGLLTWSGIGRLNNQPSHFGTVLLLGDALFSTIIGATDLGNGMFDSWMGEFYQYPDSQDYIHHDGLAWMWTGGVEVGNPEIWLYSYTLEDWVYTAQGVYPYFYSLNNGWIYFGMFGENSDEPWIYVYDTGAWIFLGQGE